ncbi:hypothetical protein RN001_014934 [Aquatica leii]|uniref:Uncharacterized protein n=1 Tax=Aquatica leii TaxID=1421715 RepID=A0AAN7NV34_9COLE|nr:hypothetical protein RN001_014934 [Aquatica leii]
MISCAEASLTAVAEPDFSSFIPIFKLIESHFRNYYNTLAITGIIDNNTQDFIDWTLHNYHQTPTIIASSDEIHATSLKNVLANVMITVVSDVKDVKKYMHLLTKYQFFSHQSYVFFIFTKQISAVFLLTEMHEYIWKNKIVNLYVVAYNTQLVLIGYNPFKKEKVEILMDDESYLTMFRNKVKNLNGYEIRGGTVEDVPRTVYYRNRVYSLDLAVIKSIFKRLNANLTIVHYSSESMATVKKALKKGEIDCALIRLFLYDLNELMYGKKFLYTYPYVLDAFVILVPTPERLPGYLNIFYIFKSSLWLCIVVTCLVLTLFVSVLDRVSLKVFKLRGREKAFFQVLRLMVNLPSSEVKRATNAKKVILTSCFWYSCFFYVVFQSSLTSTLIKPKTYPKLTTLKELAQSSYKIYSMTPDFLKEASTWNQLEHKIMPSSKSDIMNMIMSGDNSRQRQRKIHWSEENLNQEKLEAVENRKRFTFPVDTTEEVCNVHKDPQSNANSVPSVTFYSNREGGTVNTDDVHSISSRSTPTGSSGVFPNHDQHTELLQTILKTQIEIKFEINELRKKVDKSENKEINQNKVDFRLQTTTFVDKLPINNLSEIDEIEDLIKNEEILNELWVEKTMLKWSTQ